MRMGRFVRNMALALATVIASAGMLAGVAPTSHATPPPLQGLNTASAVACNAGQFCYYYNSGQAGSVAPLAVPIADLASYKFTGEGAGKGVVVKNNSASVWNRTSQSVVVYYNSNYGGASQTIAAGAKVNLNATLKNQNASHRYPPAAPAPSSWGNPVNNLSSYKVTCTFNSLCAGYTHAGTDWAVPSGTNLMAVSTGTVVGAGYDSAAGNYVMIKYRGTVPGMAGTHDIYVTYEHMSTISVKTGSTVTKGQVVGKSGNSGQSTGAHLHVSVAVDYQTMGSKGPTGHPHNVNPQLFFK